jgi:hypothetical protein
MHFPEAKVYNLSQHLQVKPSFQKTRDATQACCELPPDVRQVKPPARPPIFQRSFRSWIGKKKRMRYLSCITMSDNLSRMRLKSPCARASRNSADGPSLAGSSQYSLGDIVEMQVVPSC